MTQIDFVFVPSEINSLASHAPCWPDSDDSPGAVFLKNTADTVLEAFTNILDNVEHPRDLAQAVDEYDYISEWVEGAIPVYTHDLWKTWVDLGGYLVDTSDYYDSGMDMDEQARAALYSIGRDVASYLFDLWKDEAREQMTDLLILSGSTPENPYGDDQPAHRTAFVAGMAEATSDFTTNFPDTEDQSLIEAYDEGREAMRDHIGLDD